jgi:protease-4
MSQPSLARRIGNAIGALRRFTGNLLFVLLLVALAVVVLGSLSGPDIPRGAALVIDPRGALVEQRTMPDSFARWLLPGGAGVESDLESVLRAIREGATDDRIAMLVIELNELASLSSVQAAEIGAAISTFRATGKEVVAYGYFFGQAHYLAASFADAVYLHPSGQLILPGYGASQPYLAGLFEKLGVNVHVFRVGEFKDAVEPFIEDRMSARSREANQALVDALWDDYAKAVIENRDLEAERFAEYSQHYDRALERAGGDMARVALEYGLVDELLTIDQMRARILDTVGRAPDGDFLRIPYADYLERLPAPSVGSRNVGLIVAQGPILLGESAGATAAAETLTELVRKGRQDPTIAALVVRVDSPGGGSFASELIRQELELTQLAGKPVVASFGSTAASGGYWIASTADRIVADPASVTGSIGIFSIVPTFEQALDTVGVRTDGVRTSPLAGGPDPLAALEAPVARILQANVEHGYRQFINLVARGRDMTPDAVEAIAQGRVWTGRQALELGLVDRLGGIADAVTEAAELAGLEDYGVTILTAPESPLDLLVLELLQSLAPRVLAPSNSFATAVREIVDAVLVLDDPRHVYALCAVCAAFR